MEPYTYQSLTNERDIRLLTIYSGRGKESPMQCSLQIVSLDNNPTYITLSYTWGAPIFDRLLRIDDKEIKVTANLHAALSRLQLIDETKDWVVWADAVCIDQSNILERHQVRLMRSIYSQAAQTMAYLGHSSKPEHESLAIELGEFILRASDRLTGGQRF